MESREKMGTGGSVKGQKPCGEKGQGEKTEKMLLVKTVRLGLKDASSMPKQQSTAIGIGSLSPFPTQAPALRGSLGERWAEVLLHLLQCRDKVPGWPVLVG